MKISSIYKQQDRVFSCEIFPPKPENDIETVYGTIEDIRQLEPDFVSVTYGAGGGTKARTVEIASTIRDRYGLETLMHLTCINSSTSDMANILEELKQKGIENILALRGDMPQDCPSEPLTGELCHASDLVSLIKRKGDFTVGVAAYPETHPEAPDPDTDIKFLKKKIDAGADFIITQLFFNNDHFYSFMDLLSKYSIKVPVSAGIMPVFKSSLIKKMVTMCGATIPRGLEILLERYGHNDSDMEKAGTEYAASQITSLMENDIAGIHLYTMNRARIAINIAEMTGLKREN